MGIYQRKETGIYYLKVKEGCSYKRISLETKSEDLAQEIYQAFLLDKVKSKLIRPAPLQENPQNIPSPIREASIKPLYLSYLETCKAQGLSEYTIKRKQALWKDIKHLKRADEVTQKAVNSLLEKWNNKSSETQRRNIKNLKAFLNYCISEGKYSVDLYRTLKFPSIQTNVRETTIPESDYRLILQGCKDADFRLYLQTLWETGCRPNEITSLKKTDIDFAKGTAKVYQPKTKRHKTVYFRDEFLDAFKACPQGSLFEGAHRQGEYYAKKFQKLKEALSLPKEYCLYAFRHSFGTRMLNKTKDLHLVSKLLGHSDISITAKHYINRDNETIRRQLMEAEGMDVRSAAGTGCAGAAEE